MARPPHSPRRKLIILDLNGTILDSSHEPRPGATPDGRARFKHVYFRPHMKEFIHYLFANFEAVAVWTSNIEANALALVKLAFGPELIERLLFVFHRDACILGPDYSSQKPLELVWKAFPQYDASNTLIVDDSEKKMVSIGTGCHIAIPTFRASSQTMKEDYELKKLIQCL